MLKSRTSVDQNSANIQKMSALRHKGENKRVVISEKAVLSVDQKNKRMSAEQGF